MRGLPYSKLCSNFSAAGIPDDGALVEQGEVTEREGGLIL